MERWSAQLDTPGPYALTGLVQGTNVLAIQLLNQSEGSSDLLFLPRMWIIPSPKKYLTGLHKFPTPAEAA